MKLLLATFFFMFVTKLTFSQPLKDDLQLVLEKKLVDPRDFDYYKRSGNDKKILETKEKSFIAKINPIALAGKGAMALYQNVISPQLFKTCPYEITCSNFSKQAIEHFGFLKGIFLSADRLMRCNRIALLDIHQKDINPLTGAIQDPITNY